MIRPTLCVVGRIFIVKQKLETDHGGTVIFILFSGRGSLNERRRQRPWHWWKVYMENIWIWEIPCGSWLKFGSSLFSSSTRTHFTDTYNFPSLSRTHTHTHSLPHPNLLSVVSESLLLVEYFLLFFSLSICQGGRNGGNRERGREKWRVRRCSPWKHKC